MTNFLRTIPHIVNFSLLIIAMIIFANLKMQNLGLLDTNFMFISLLVDWGLVIPAIFYFGVIQQGYLKFIPLKIVIAIGCYAALMLTPDDVSDKIFVLYYYPKMIALLVVFFVSQSLYKLAKGLGKSTELSGEMRVEFLAHYCFGKGQLSKLVLSEWIGFYYLFCGWGKNRKLKTNEFSYHKNNSTASMLIFVCLLSLPEMLVAHLLLNNWSSTAAWIVTIFSIYFMYIAPAHFNAIKHRFVRLTDSHLELRNGLLITTDIPLAQIKNIEQIYLTHPKLAEKTTLKANFLDNANLLISLHQKQRVSMVAGLYKQVDSIALGLDDAASFVKLWNEKNK